MVIEFFKKSDNLDEYTGLYICLAHHGQIDLNKMLNTAKGTHQTSKWTPLGPQINEN